MRIISGRWRGLHLADVGTGEPAAHLRPTSDRVREAIFNMLINGGYGDPVTDARVLDLFAGTGALGLEAMSRGAAHVTLVDNGIAARSLIAKNLALTKAEALHLRSDATKLPPNTGRACDLIFLDPPYGKGLGELSMTAAIAGNWVAPEALIVWEESTKPLPPSGFDQLDQRRYGDTIVTILRAP
ncbi:MAG: 16S rRNA (guanine(966)-N(2))-methyltransferase RsmD [Paracoccaceae bacterium]